MGQMLQLILVSVAVALNIASAIALKEAAELVQPTIVIITALVSLVVVINLLRLAFWSAIHRRYNLSDSYPLTSIFFPMILLISALYGEEIGIFKLVGTLFITIGVALHMGNGAAKTEQKRAAEMSS